VNVSALPTEAAVTVESLSTVLFKESLTLKSLTLMAFTVKATGSLHTSGLETEHAFTYTVTSVLLVPVMAAVKSPVRPNCRGFR